MADAGYLTIGKVVARLQERYPDLSVSKVRYLEDEGLLNPSRTPGGYRLYSQHDVRRLETILYLQKTRFMPLSVIREELERGATITDPASVNPTAAGPQGTGAALAAPVQVDDEETISKYHPIQDMPELLGVTVGFVQQLADVGVIKLERSPHGRVLVDGHDFAIIRLCDRLGHFGLSPRTLRPYVQAARRESGMVEQAMAPYARKGSALGTVTDETRAQFQAALEEMVSLTDQLRDTLIKRQVKQSFPQMYAEGDADTARRGRQ